MMTRSISFRLLRIVFPAFLLMSLSSTATHVDDVDPCELLNDQLIQDFFEVSAASLNRKSSESSNPSCTVNWAKPNMDELEKQHQEAMSQYMQDKMAGKDVKYPTYPSNNQISLTIYGSEFKDKLSAKNSFNTAMQRLQKGTTTEINGKMETMFQYETVPVDGVADDAHWVDGLSQLSVLSGIRIFHLKIKVYDNAEENQKSAEAIARKLALTLN